MATGTTLQAAAAALNLANGFALGGAATIDTQVNALTLSGIIANGAGSGSITKLGSGTLTLTAANTYSGGTTVEAGTLSLTNGSAIGTGQLVLAQGTTLDLNGSFTLANTIAVTGDPLFNVAAGNSATLSGTIADGAAPPGVVEKIGAGTLTLTGANLYSGGTLLDAGTLGVGSNAALGSGMLTIAAGTTLQASAPALSLANPVTLGGLATIDTQANALTLSGTIANGASAGGFTKLGSGVLTLTGSNGFSGGITIATGTLIGSTSSLGSGDILDNAALVFDQPVNGKFAAQISGTGSLTKRGAGLLDLAGSNSYTGPTTVVAGTLVVSGAIAGSPVTVQSGATLGGAGTVGPLTAQSGATVTPGVVTALTTLNVSGDTSFAAGSTFLINVNGPGQSDKLAVTGKATLSGGTVQVTAANGVYSPSTRYTILTASGGVAGVFAQLGTTPNLAFLTPQLSYDANDVFLGFKQMAPVPVFPNVALTRNQAWTAFGIQSLGPTNSIYQVVLGQTVTGARLAFDALSGEIHASAVTAAMEDSRLPREAILDRLSETSMASQLGASTTMTGAYAADLPSAKGPALAPVAVQMYQPHMLDAWGQGFGDWGHSGTDHNAASLQRRTGGFVAGLDATQNLWSGLVRLGVAGGYTNDQLTVQQRQSSGTFESVFGGLYAGASFGAIQLRAGALYGSNTTSTSRSMIFPGFFSAAGSSYGGSMAQAFTEAGYRIPVAGFGGLGLTRASLEPFMGAAAVHIHQNGFAETGGIGALAGFGRSYDLVTTTLGLRSEATLAGPLPLTVRTLLGWRHAFGDVVPDTVMGFESGGQPFPIAGLRVDRDALLAEFGLSYAISPMVAASVSYSGQYGRRASDSAFKGRIDISFW
jgi:outer membrane autotransporter protein